MTNINKKSKLYIFVIILVLLLATAVYLCHNAFAEGRINRLYPVLTDSALYIPVESGESSDFEYTFDRDVNFREISFVITHVSSEGNGSIAISLNDDTKILNEKDIIVGEWNTVSLGRKVHANESVTVSVRADNCEPYLMYVPQKGMESLPFGLNASSSDDSISNVSIGFVEELPETASFTSSLEFAPLLAKLFILVLIGSFSYAALFKGENHFAYRILGNLVICCVFAFICLNIFSQAYQNGVCITADSSGYLREAVNLKAGNGFSYDGLAGYNTWFANWPILYPFAISLMMLATGTDAYIASKLLAAAIVLVILIALKIRFKNRAFIYSLALINLGFINLNLYTWSEPLFILFLMLFAFKLSDIINGHTKIKDFILLGLWGLLTFLTRYFGIYVFMVTGCYILILFIRYMKSKDRSCLLQCIKLTVTSFISGILCIGYLLMNKIMNGMPSGVSRSEWWDDYRTLTVDLINSLITEVFNVFHFDCGGLLSEFGIVPKLIFLILVLGILYIFVIRKIKLFSFEGVMLGISGSYYIVFTVIRYFSSMDTFYFRFFEPASFILTIGLIHWVLTRIEDHSFRKINITKSACVVSMLLIVLLLAECIQTIAATRSNTSPSYYEIIKSEWDAAYSEIPPKSVVIFSDLDYRSEYYRSDVVGGEITTVDTMDDLKKRYFGSDYLCIQKEYAYSMIECLEYSEDVTNMLSSALENSKAQKYMTIKL